MTSVGGSHPANLVSPNMGDSDRVSSPRETPSAPPTVCGGRAYYTTGTCGGSEIIPITLFTPAETTLLQRVGIPIRWGVQAICAPFSRVVGAIRKLFFDIFHQHTGGKINIYRMPSTRINKVICEMTSQTKDSGKKLVAEILAKPVDERQFEKDAPRVTVNGEHSSATRIRTELRKIGKKEAADNFARLCTQTLLTDINTTFFKLEEVPECDSWTVASHKGVGLSRYTFEEKDGKIIITISNPCMLKLAPNDPTLENRMRREYKVDANQNCYLYSQGINVTRTITMRKEDFVQDWSGKESALNEKFAVEDSYSLMTLNEMEKAVQTDKAPNETIIRLEEHSKLGEVILVKSKQRDELTMKQVGATRTATPISGASGTLQTPPQPKAPPKAKFSLKEWVFIPIRRGIKSAAYPFVQLLGAIERAARFVFQGFMGKKTAEATEITSENLESANLESAKLESTKIELANGIRGLVVGKGREDEQVDLETSSGESLQVLGMFRRDMERDGVHLDGQLYCKGKEEKLIADDLKQLKTRYGKEGLNNIASFLNQAGSGLLTEDFYNRQGFVIGGDATYDIQDEKDPKTGEERVRFTIRLVGSPPAADENAILPIWTARAEIVISKNELKADWSDKAPEEVMPGMQISIENRRLPTSLEECRTSLLKDPLEDIRQLIVGIGRATTSSTLTHEGQTIDVLNAFHGDIHRDGFYLDGVQYRKKSDDHSIVENYQLLKEKYGAAGFRRISGFLHQGATAGQLVPLTHNNFNEADVLSDAGGAQYYIQNETNPETGKGQVRFSILFAMRSRKLESEGKHAFVAVRRDIIIPEEELKAPLKKETAIEEVLPGMKAVEYQSPWEASAEEALKPLQPPLLTEKGLSELPFSGLSDDELEKAFSEPAG